MVENVAHNGLDEAFRGRNLDKAGLGIEAKLLEAHLDGSCAKGLEMVRLNVRMDIMVDERGTGE